MNQARLPTTMTLSLMLHVGAGAAWLRMQAIGPAMPARVIGDVDLMIKVRPQPGVAAPVKTPPSTWNFLKMALPAIPKAGGPLDVKTHEPIKKPLVDAPERLADKGRLDKLAKVDALDLGRRRSAAAQLDAGELETRTRHHAIADAPKLEEVGVRRAPRKVLEMAALEEQQGGRLQPQALDALSKAAPLRGHAAPSAAPLLPEEAAPAAKRGALGKVADLLGSEPPPLQLQGAVPAERPKRLDALQATLPKKDPSAAMGEKKKAMEIEGPLASRKLVSYSLPPFPGWLSAQGVVEAEVRIKFYVNPAGDVAPEMQVETTSGYGRLDRLAMESLKMWQFEPAPGQGRQWGIITFRFLSE